MKITIENKEYTITNDAHIEYRSDRVDPMHWVALDLIDESDHDESDDPHQYIAWYYAPEMDNEGFELDRIDYEEPNDLQDIGY